MQNVDDPVNQLIRRRIRNIRQRKKISVRNAAKLCDIPESSYSCMENGFYRISLLNLNKMLSGLGVAIEDVWPRQQQKLRPEAGDNGSRRDPGYLRFQEIHLLSEARKSAFFRADGGGFNCLYSFNIDHSDGASLRAALQSGARAGWKVFSRESGQAKVCLCLLNPKLPELLLRLIEIYLDLWLSAAFTQEAAT